jgi:cysteine sulfinate desulfinase/cysteine desulfurase-like protein
LRAMRVPPEIGVGAVRFSLGRQTTIEEITAVTDQLTQIFGPITRRHLRPRLDENWLAFQH